MLLPPRNTCWFDQAPGSTLPPAPGVSYQRVAPDRIQLVSHPTLIPGLSAARVELRAGDDPINSSGVRNEWADFRADIGGVPNQRERFGDTGFYGFCFTVPSSFRALSNWNMFWQLHHAAGTGSPPFALRYDAIRDPDASVRGHLYVAWRESPSSPEQYLTLLPNCPYDVTIGVILDASWNNPGHLKLQVGTAPYGTPVTEFPVYKEIVGRPTYPRESNAGYWKGGNYAGDFSGDKLVHYQQGMVRRSSVDEVKRWFLGTTITEPPPGPPPPVTVKIEKPESSAILVDRKLDTLVSVSGGRARRVNWFVGGVQVASEFQAPYGDGSPYALPDTVPAGNRSLRATVLLEDGSTVEASQPVVVPELPEPPPPPPPPPPPTEVEELRAELARVTADRDGLLLKLAKEVREGDEMAEEIGVLIQKIENAKAALA